MTARATDENTADIEESRSGDTRSSDSRTTEASILSGDGLVYEYGDHTVLRGVDVDIPAGKTTAVIGPNGTGKTTLLRLLLNQLSSTEGTVEYSGPEAARPIGYLPQQPTFRPRFTAAETVVFYASLLGVDVDPTNALDRVGLAAAADRRVEALSGGMQRLLGIAQSLVGDPPVVVADEPASGLDPTMATAAFEILAERAAAGTAVVVSSHDLSLVERFADRVVLLYEGTVVARGSPADLVDASGTDSLWGVYESTVGTPPTRSQPEPEDRTRTDRAGRSTEEER